MGRKSNRATRTYRVKMRLHNPFTIYRGKRKGRVMLWSYQKWFVPRMEKLIKEVMRRG